MQDIDVKGFNRFQNRVLIIDANLNEQVDPEDECIALCLEGFKRGEKVPFDHPKFVELRTQYAEFLRKKVEG